MSAKPFANSSTMTEKERLPDKQPDLERLVKIALLTTRVRRRDYKQGDPERRILASAVVCLEDALDKLRRGE